MDTELERIEALKEQAREVVRTREPESLQHALASIILRLENPSS